MTPRLLAAALVLLLLSAAALTQGCVPGPHVARNSDPKPSSPASGDAAPAGPHLFPVWRHEADTSLRYGYIDASGRLVIPYRFEYARNFEEGLAAVRVDSRWAYIGRTGRTPLLPRLTTNPAPSTSTTAPPPRSP